MHEALMTFNDKKSLCDFREMWIFSLNKFKFKIKNSNYNFKLKIEILTTFLSCPKWTVDKHGAYMLTIKMVRQRGNY